MSHISVYVRSLSRGCMSLSKNEDHAPCINNSYRMDNMITRIGTRTAPVLSVAFSPDGKQLASGEQDKSVRVYTRRRTLWGYRLD